MAHELRFEDVRKRLVDAGGRKTAVFEGLELTVGEGEHLAVVGRSGVGKSTLLRLANRLEEPDGGVIRLGGRPLPELEVTGLRRTVALVCQKPFLFPGSVLDNVTLPDRFRDAAPDGDRAKRLLLLAGLEEELLTREGSALSVGQQQRVCLARALYARPRVLLLDETTSSLDPRLALQVLGALSKLAREEGLTLVHVTHETDKIRLADRVVLLGGGKVAEEGRPTAFLEKPGSEAGLDFLGG